MHLEEFLHETTIVLAASVAVVFLSARLRLPSIVGLILTGMLIGPTGLALIEDAEQVETLAEIGVVLLLFIIGLELSISQLKGMGRAFLLGGGAQALLTSAVTFGVALAGGTSWRVALFASWAVALSSTAVVLKLYDQRRETHTPQGRVVLGILLFQDFLIVPLIVLTPVVAGTASASAADLALRFVGSLAAIAAVAVVARFVMPKLLDQLVGVKVRELFVLASLLICLALAWFTHSLGFSLALGAFLAGILVSETEYSHQAVADIVPFRDVFASIFFVSVGMLVDLSFAMTRLPLLLGLAAAVVVVKSLAAGVAARLVGYPLRIAVLSGLALAQIGEFSFVLMEVGRANGLLGDEMFQTLLVTAVLTLLATPMLIRAAPVLGERAASWTARGASDEPPEESRALSSHVIIVGYGLNGSLLCRVLSEARIPYIVIELNGATVREARKAGVPMLFGDASRREILEHAGVERANAVVFAISDVAVIPRGVRLVRELNPAAGIIVRSRMVQDIEPLRDAGADEVVTEEFESAIEIFTLVLERFHVPRNIIRAQVRVLRGEGYRAMRSPSGSRDVSDAVLEVLEAGTSEIYRVGESSRAAGSTLRDLDLRRICGASVIAVVRGEKAFPNPSAEMILETGDCLVLVGSHGEIDQALVCLDRRDEILSAP